MIGKVSIGVVLLIFVLGISKAGAGDDGGDAVHIETVASTEIVGISVRTTNCEEMQEKSAKLPKLWDRFYGNIFGNVIVGQPVYGVYSDYESDESGQYTVLAGVTLDNTDIPAGLEAVGIPSGKYLVFEETGEMPGAVIRAWQSVWQYFSDPKTHYKRAFTVDFERYEADDRVAIYIAIK